jgi:hypothetical protein
VEDAPEPSSQPACDVLDGHLGDEIQIHLRTPLGNPLTE